MDAQAGLRERHHAINARCVLNREEVSRWRRGILRVPYHAMMGVSNQSFANWGDVVGDRVIATAILDRLLHHGITVTIRGDSYRLKEKLKAGLLMGTEATA